MNRRTRLSAIAASVTLSGLILSHEVEAREWLLAQAKPQSQPQPSSAQSQSSGQSSSGQSSPGQSSGQSPSGQPSSGQSSSGQSSSGQPVLRQPVLSPPASGSSTLRRQDPFNRYSTQRNSVRSRRFPIEPVPMPDERRMPIDLAPKKTLPRIPDSFASPSTGIMAQVIVSPICSIASSTTSNCVARPYQGELKVMPISGDRQFRVSTDQRGQLQLRLSPGVYVIRPTSSDFPAVTSQTVTVINGMMRSMRIEFQGYPKPQPLPAPLPGQTNPGTPTAQPPLQPPSGWQPSVISQPLYPPIGQ